MKNKQLPGFILLMTFFCASSFAQTFSEDALIKLWSVGDTSQTRKSGSTFYDIVSNPNKDRFLAIVSKVKARKLNKRLQIRFYMYQFYGNHFFRIADTVNTKAYCFQIVKDAALLGDEQLLSEMYTIYGGLCVPEEEMYYLLKGAEIRQKSNVNSVYIYANYVRLSHLAYDYMFDYQNSAKYAALGVTKFLEPNTNIHNYILLLDLAGDSYVKINKPDSAIYYYQLIRQKIGDVRLNPAQFFPKLDKHSLSLWDNIALGGIARAYMLKSQYDTAYGLLIQNLRSSIAMQEWADVSMAQSALAEIDFVRKDFSSAANRYSLARRLATSGRKDILLSKALEGGAKAFAAMGRYDSAYTYQKEYLQLKPILDAKRNESKVQLVEAQLRYDGMQATVAQTKNEISRQRLLRNIILLVVFLSGVFVLLIFNRNRLKYQLRQTQLEQQKQLAEAEAELTRKDVLFAQDQLAEVIQHISEKNKLIEGLESRLAENEKADIQEVLRNFTILTGNDWLKFKDYFEKAYPNYWERLQQKLPKLTQSDERLLALSKLQLGNKEIAAAIGISPESVRVSIHRLRKKIEAIYPDTSFEEFIATI